MRLGNNPGFGANARRSSAGASVTFQNARLVRDILGELETSLAYDERTGLLKPARTIGNRMMRDGAKDIAEKVLIPQLHRAARSSPHADFARAMAATARAKSDRIVTVSIGGVNPAVSGFKPYRRSTIKGTPGTARDNRRWRTSMAWGSEFGPHPDNPVNHYGKPRKEAGYWVLPAVRNSIPEAQRQYAVLIEKVITTYGRYR